MIELLKFLLESPYNIILFFLLLAFLTFVMNFILKDFKPIVITYVTNNIVKKDTEEN